MVAPPAAALFTGLAFGLAEPFRLFKNFPERNYMETNLLSGINIAKLQLTKIDSRTVDIKKFIQEVERTLTFHQVHDVDLQLFEPLLLVSQFWFG